MYQNGSKQRQVFNMIRMINGLLGILKMLMLLVCFVFSFYIIANMYRRLDKNLVDSVRNFIPFVLLFIAFAVNFVLRQKAVNQNLFYNITCCLVFGMIMFSIYRTLCDKNMVIMLRLGYDINFNYFADVIAPIKVMLYGLLVSNILLVLSDSKLLSDKKEVKTTKKAK